MTQITVLDALIIGTGFGGIGMAIQLQQKVSTNYLLLEKADDVGGVWRDNRYPGAACDVPSHLYSFSFAEFDRWSRKFAGQAEIHGYLRHCVDRFGIAERIRFNQEVDTADFDADKGIWTVVTRTGEQYHARAVICAMG